MLRLIMKITFTALVIALVFTMCKNNKENSINTFDINSPEELKEFFTYKTDRLPFTCAHRGGAGKLFPENCIATFENTLSHVHSMIETDPRYTLDSVIVLMHDPNLARTTNGKGNVSDFTLQELKNLRLKDSEGNLTDYQIPTLDEALDWAKGKTILVLDRKDVPVEIRIKKIKEKNAEANAIVIAYTIEEIKKVYKLNPNIIMEIMLPDTSQFEKFESTGVPWNNVVAFVSHNIVVNSDIFEMIHNKGAMCIVGSSRNHDIAFAKGEIDSSEELAGKYSKMITDGADIIEADLAIEAGLSIREILPIKKSDSKGKFFGTSFIRNEQFTQ
jgi:glycerophosphoryl diester phosphodiesterase